MAGGRWREGGGGREVAGGGRASFIRRAASGVRPPAHLQEREVDDRPSRLGAPLLSQHELQPLTRHLQGRGSVAAHTPAAGVPATPGCRGTYRRAACRGAIKRAACRGAIWCAACRDTSECAACRGASGRAACRSSWPRQARVVLPLDCGRLGERHSRRRTRRRWGSSFCGSRGDRRGPWPLTADPHNRRLHLHHDLGGMAWKLPEQVSQRRGLRG